MRQVAMVPIAVKRKNAAKARMPVMGVEPLPEKKPTKRKIVPNALKRNPIDITRKTKAQRSQSDQDMPVYIETFEYCATCLSNSETKALCSAVLSHPGRLLTRLNRLPWRGAMSHADADGITSCP